MIMMASLDFIFMKVYARLIDAVDGVYIFYSSFLFLYTGAFGSERRRLLFGMAICSYPTWLGGGRSRYHGCGAGHWPYFGHFLNGGIDDLGKFASLSSQSSLFSFPQPLLCVTLIALTTHNGSTPPNIPISLANPTPPPPSPSFILPSQTSTISTSRQPLHHK